MDNKGFIKLLSEKYNTEVTELTYSLSYVDTNGVIIDHGVFLFRDEKNLFFLEAEYQPKILGFNIKTEPKTDYFKFSVDFSEIVNYFPVIKSSAYSYLRNKKKQIKQANKFFSIFRETLVYVKLSDKEIFLNMPIRNFRSIIN